MNFIGSLKRPGIRGLAGLAGIAVSMAMVVSSCSKKPAEQRGGKGGGAPVPVLTARATTRDVPMEIKTIGTVQAYSVVSIRPQITGPITQVHFKEGQEVKAGDRLFTIDPSPWEAALNQAQANLKRDEAQRTNAKLLFERTKNLFESKIASQQDFDTAEANFQAAQSTVVADQAAISTAQIFVNYTTIRAPIEGRTGNLAVKEGNLVKAPDDVMVTIAQIHPIYVSFAMPEQNLPAIRRRTAEATLRVEASAPGADAIAVGELTFIDNVVDTNTGTILLKGTFANKGTVLWPGQFVQTTLTLSNIAGATVVPSQAVQTGQNGEFIFVVKADETVEPRAVVTGITYDGVRVIRSGITPGETVVTDGQLRLTPGAKVNVKAPEGAGSTTNEGPNAGPKS